MWLSLIDWTWTVLELLIGLAGAAAMWAKTGRRNDTGGE